MIIYQRDDTDNLGIALANLLLDQMVADQVADCLRAVLVAHTADAQIEGGQEVFF